MIYGCKLHTLSSLSSSSSLGSSAFDARRTSLNGRSLRFIVLSRRSRYRAGTRYFRRGIDHEGHVANFNESEQILIYDDRRIMTGTWNEVGTIMSFVQIRGSVPLYWAEVNTLRYKPDLQVMELQDSVRSVCSCSDQC